MNTLLMQTFLLRIELWTLVTEQALFLSYMALSYIIGEIAHFLINTTSREVSSILRKNKTLTRWYTMTVMNFHRTSRWSSEQLRISKIKKTKRLVISLPISTLKCSLAKITTKPLKKWDQKQQKFSKTISCWDLHKLFQPQRKSKQSNLLI